MTAIPSIETDRFHHEALFYADREEFLAGTVPFVREGIAAGEPVLVAVAEPKIRMLERELGPVATKASFTDIEALGRNPARIIPAWRDFVDTWAGQGLRVRGIGEPTWPGRSPEEIVECHHHESLLNLAFEDGPPWRLLCPYDSAGLPAEAVQEARRTHPYLNTAGARSASNARVEPQDRPGPFSGPLQPPPAAALRIELADSAELHALRQLAQGSATEAGLDRERAMDFVLVANELATNSLRHAGGTGTLRIWSDNDSLFCEVCDRGRIDNALVGRERPSPEQAGGRGLWLSNQVCDLLQIRATAEGLVVRARMQISG